MLTRIAPLALLLASTSSTSGCFAVLEGCASCGIQTSLICHDAWLKAFPPSRPEIAPATTPATAHATTPATAPVTTPATAHATTPATAPVTTPATAPEIAPEIAPVTTPAPAAPTAPTTRAPVIVDAPAPRRPEERSPDDVANYFTLARKGVDLLAGAPRTLDVAGLHVHAEPECARCVGGGPAGADGIPLPFTCVDVTTAVFTNAAGASLRLPWRRSCRTNTGDVDWCQDGRPRPFRVLAVEGDVVIVEGWELDLILDDAEWVSTSERVRIAGLRLR